jgi:hypothetical protein
VKDTQKRLSVRKPLLSSYNYSLLQRSAGGRISKMRLCRTTLILAGMFMMAALLASAAASTPPPQKIFKLHAQHEVGDASRQINVRIYQDATSSMAGFVSQRSNVGYKAFVQRLEQTITLSWPDSRVECWKFGAQPTPLNTATCYLQLDSPGFFGLHGKDNITRIDRIIDQAESSSLQIILTDLYQDEADLASVFQSVRQKVFGRGLAVGIIAVRSPFSGTIYDIGLYKANKTWKGDRPWYALVVGREPDIEQLFDQLTRPPMKVPAERLLILSVRLWQKPVTWQTLVAEPNRVAEDPRLITVIGSTVPFRVYRLQDSIQSGLKLRLPAVPASFRPTLDASRPKAIRVTIDTRLISSNGTEATPQGAAIAECSGATISLTWNMKSLLHNPEYAEAVSMEFDPDAIVFPGFVTQWTVSLSDVLGADAASAKEFDGSKTQNLAELVNGLWRMLVQQQGTDLGTLYLYFRR